MDQHSLKKSHKLEYPSIFIREPSNNLPLFLASAKKGNLPILVAHNGRNIEIDRISPDLRSIQILLKLQPVILLKSKDERMEIRSIDDYINSDEVIECL